ncbi:uncharacterized protein METZ01_LOCUS279542, partial [marine metagenome]
MIAAAIDKYVYVTVMQPFSPGIYLKYSELEQVERLDQIRHPIIRETLQVMNPDTAQIEITTLADIPSGTGLGSSGSFTTALLRALYAHQRRLVHPQELAEMACFIEIDRLGEPIGKQDQYIAAYGGITSFNFNPDDTVTAEPLSISAETLHDLEDNLLLFFTGLSRNASSILDDQNKRTQESDIDILNNLHVVKELGLRSQRALEDGDATLFGEIMHEHWEHKKQRSSGMSNPQIDEWYEFAVNNGAVGGKLVGAGGGGFLMFYARDRDQ